MISPPLKPFQFDLRSIFLATSAIAVALGLLKWLGPLAFLVLVVLVVQCSAVIAILIKSKGTAWLGVVIPQPMVVFLFIAAALSQFNKVGELPDAALASGTIFWASLAGWFVGGLTASEATRKQSWFLRWSWLLLVIWLLLVVGVIGTIDWLPSSLDHQPPRPPQ